MKDFLKKIFISFLFSPVERQEVECGIKIHLPKSSSDLGHPILAVTHGQANNSQGEAGILSLLNIREGIHGLLCPF